MKWRRPIARAFAVVCLLLFQIGCGRGVAIAREEKASLPASTPGVKQQKAESSAVSDQPAPTIHFKNVLHNFGEIGPGTKNLCEFEFTNTGGAVLRIEKVSKTCGCTPFTLKKYEYEPGESGILKVSYHASKRPGPATKRLYVHSNDRERPKLVLTIEAQIVLKVNHEPERLDLSLEKENGGCPQITLFSRDNQPFAIKSFKSTGNSIRADVNSSEKATRFVLQPKVDMGKLDTNLNGQVEIGLTHPECDVVTIPFKTLPRFSITPPIAVILNGRPKTPQRKEVWVLNNYGRDFEIESTSSEEGNIKVLKQEKVGNRYRFDLEISPPAYKGKARIFRDVFYINIKSGEKLRMPCRGFYARKQDS